jgi:hypothetical protein
MLLFLKTKGALNEQGWPPLPRALDRSKIASVGEDDGRSHSIRDRVAGGAASRLDLEEVEQTVEASVLRGPAADERIGTGSVPRPQEHPPSTIVGSAGADVNRAITRCNSAKERTPFGSIIMRARHSALKACNGTYCPAMLPR